MLLSANGLYGHIQANNFKSLLLLAGFVGLVAAYWAGLCLAWTAISYLIDFSRPPLAATEAFDLIWAHAIAKAIANWHVPLIAAASWFTAAWMFYATIIRSASGARAVSRRQEPRLFATVERLAIAAGLPMPRVEIMESASLNAYAAGLSPHTATIAVTRGLLQRLEPREIEAVLAHEMAHIKNRDVRLMVVALIFAGGITLAGKLIGRLVEGRRGGYWTAGDFDVGGGWTAVRHKHSGLTASGAPAFVAIIGALLVAFATMALSHIGAVMTRLAISRAREFIADAGAVELTRDPDALTSALIKISGHDYVPGASDEMAAIMISSAFDKDDFVEGLLSTHPTIEARISALATHAGARLPTAPRRSRQQLRSASAG